MGNKMALREAENDYYEFLLRNHKKISKPKTYRQSDGNIKLDKIIHETVYGSEKSYHSTVPKKKISLTVKTNPSVTFLPSLHHRKQVKSRNSEVPQPSLVALSENLHVVDSRDSSVKKLVQQNEMLRYRLEKSHQKYQQTIENIAAENSKLRNQVRLSKN